jgi:DeoR family fructose operon transcriptional repressor
MTTTDSTKGTRGTASGPGAGKLQHHRQREIYVLALRSGSVDVSDLARRFDVTTETIRRDLSDLQEQQLLRRVHGGAVPLEHLHHEPMVDARDMLNAEQKLRIAREAINEVPEQGSVIIDSGSTGQRLAEVFPVDRAVHVVTDARAPRRA